MLLLALAQDETSNRTSCYPGETRAEFTYCAFENNSFNATTGSKNWFTKAFCALCLCSLPFFQITTGADGEAGSRELLCCKADLWLQLRFLLQVLLIPWVHTRSWPLVGHGIAGWLMWKHWCCLQNTRLISARLVSQLDLSGPDWLLQLQIISAYFIPNKISNGHNVLFSENNTP